MSKFFPFSQKYSALSGARSRNFFYWLKALGLVHLKTHKAFKKTAKSIWIDLKT